MTHNSTPDLLEVEHLHRHAIEIAIILARHPTWRRMQRRRETSKDHSNAKTWEEHGGREKLVVGAGTPVLAQWESGLAKVENSELVGKLFTEARFAKLAAGGRTMLRPGSADTIVGVTLDPTAPEPFVFTDTSVLDSAPMDSDEQPTLDDMDDDSLDALIDFQDGLIADLHAEGESTVAGATANTSATANTKALIATTVEYDGKNAKKGILVRRSFEATHLASSREMRCRGYMIGPPRQSDDATAGDGTESAIHGADSGKLYKKDPVVVLVNIPGYLAITIARVAEIHVRRTVQPALQTDGIAWSSMSPEIYLKVQVHGVRAVEAPSADDGNLVTVPQMWSGLISVPGDLVSAVNPDQVTNDGKLAWSISASTLRALGDVLWERHQLRSGEFPKVSISTMLPYKDLQNNAVFCDTASALGEASGIGDPNKRRCPKCQKHCKSEEMRAHIAAHVLKREMDPRVCGYCGTYGHGCTVGLRHSSGFGASKVYKPCGDCKVDRHPYQAFSIDHASKGATAVCSQRPMKCPMCEGEVFVWKYAMHAHVYEHHCGAPTLRKLLEDPEYTIHDNEWGKLGAKAKKRQFLLPADGFPMDADSATAVTGSASSTSASIAASSTSAPAPSEILDASQQNALSQITAQNYQLSEMLAIRNAAAAAASTAATCATSTATTTAMATTATTTDRSSSAGGDGESGSRESGSRQSDLPPRGARAGAAAALAAVRNEGAPPPSSP